MNTTDPETNTTFTPCGVNITLSSLTTTTTSPLIRQPPTHPLHIYDPEFTIMVVLGLSLLLAGLAAFLAVCRRPEQEGDVDGSCTPGERSTRRGRGLSTEPQLKVWRRLGSYRRSHNMSFRRPPHRRPHQRDRTRVTQSPGSETPQTEASVEPPPTTPCLFDYVTEI